MSLLEICKQEYEDRVNAKALRYQRKNFSFKAKFSEGECFNE